MSPGYSSTFREQTLVSCFASRFSFIELTTFGKMPTLKVWSRTSTFQKVSARLSKNSASRTSASDASFSRHASTSCHWWFRKWSGFRCRFWCTIITLMPATALVSLRTSLFFFPLVTYTYSFHVTWALWTLDHCSCFDFSVSEFLIYTPFHHRF